MKRYFAPFSKNEKGFSLVEVMISVAIFALLAGAAYQVVTAMLKGTHLNREAVSISSMADEYLEIVRNLPYSQIGTATGNPNGILPDFAHPVLTTQNGNDYSIYYEVTYIDDGADGTIILGTDSVPNDYKQVKLSITNILSNKTYYFLTTIVPKGLEGLASGGALSLQVIDASGNPVSGASIAITSVGLTPAISLSRTSDSAGKWVEVGLPNGTNAYHIVVTKSGYSSDSTNPIVTGTNPNPTKPDATILNGQITSVSFAIDLTSTLTFNTVDNFCAPIGSVGLRVVGAKMIGTSPTVNKFDNTYTTNGSGIYTIPTIEWDTYIPTLTGGTYMIYGSSPIQQINLLPNTNQSFTLNLGPSSTNSLLAIVKDAGTGNPIEGASVRLEKSPSFDDTKLTGGSLWSQQSWAGGNGQATWSAVNRYDSDDGNIDTSSGIKLLSSGGVAIVSSGTLTSSTFDTGTTGTTYTNITWQPSSQSSGATAKFQVATNNDNATWNYVGPDGTTSTYFTTPGTSIHSSNGGNQYIRYKAYLSTTTPSHIPVVTSVTVNYVSGCFTPGQTIFTGLSTGTHTLTVSMSGYTTKIIHPFTISSGYNVQAVSLTP